MRWPVGGSGCTAEAMSSMGGDMENFAVPSMAPAAMSSVAPSDWPRVWAASRMIVPAAEPWKV